MRWSIEVANLHGDKNLVIEILERAGYRMETVDGGQNPVRVLHHAKYDTYDSASQVKSDSKNLAEKLNRFSMIDGEAMGISFALVHRHNPDGSTNRFNFAEANIMLPPISASGTITTVPNPAISEEERRRMAEEYSAQESERRRAAKVNLVAMALQNAHIFEVMELMKRSEPTATELGHIVDMILDESDGDLSWYTSGKQLRRFNHSINHPSVFGLGARHALEKSTPPAKPMTREEARGFARGLGAAWMKRLEDGVKGV